MIIVTDDSFMGLWGTTGGRLYRAISALLGLRPELACLVWFKNELRTKLLPRGTP